MSRVLVVTGTFSYVLKNKNLKIKGKKSADDVLMDMVIEDLAMIKSNHGEMTLREMTLRNNRAVFKSEMHLCNTCNRGIIVGHQCNKCGANDK